MRCALLGYWNEDEHETKGVAMVHDVPADRVVMSENGTYPSIELKTDCNINVRIVASLVSHPENEQRDSVLQFCHVPQILDVKSDITMENIILDKIFLDTVHGIPKLFRSVKLAVTVWSLNCDGVVNFLTGCISRPFEIVSARTIRTRKRNDALKKNDKIRLGEIELNQPKLESTLQSYDAQIEKAMNGGFFIPVKLEEILKDHPYYNILDDIEMSCECSNIN
jgi:hypothetical protein